ncbi:hypothetical protein [Leptolyngbya sp. FACHB-8]|jgi:hypothetical protein|uniref:hypothetical protein n=1 Tax=unclassified Leptolyngbya TaxID=2650499 RepID=UPI00168692DA|nr:hypothetical protein [Leptolyngbya sp. FACHB-8]MBD1913252.1 hypothetical protein [Leptolyngbya sp. FACHB-8]
MNTKLMKIMVSFVAVVLTFMSSIPSAIAAEAGSTLEVQLYEHSDFQGKSLPFYVGGVRSEPISPQLINQVSSLSVPSGVAVTLIDQETGRRATYRGSYSYVGDFMNDRADSVEIVQDCSPDAEVC